MKLIRWQREKLSGEDKNARYRLTAFLVSGPANESKKKKTLTTKKLAAIEERFIHLNIPRTRAFQQGLFWTKIEKAFDQLEISGNKREELERQVAIKVPRPSDNYWALWGVTCIPQFEIE